MHWAIDYLGKEVAADRISVYSSRFRCPCCGEPVFHKKRGVERRAHFAHFSSSPDCELYYPGSGGDPTFRPSQMSGASKGTWREATNGASLYLKIESRHQATLQIRLPIVADVSDLQGSITLNSTYGVPAPISISALSKAIYRRVPMSCPPATCTASRGAEEVASQVEQALSEFKFANNFFRASPVGGVLLHPDDPLEAGTSYWLITQTFLRNAVTALGLKVEEHPDAGGWHRYLLSMPGQEVLARPTIQASLEQFLGRAITSAAKRAIVVYPPPNHFDPDGIGVYGQETTSLLVRCPEGLEVRAAGTSTASTARQELEFEPGFVRITGLSQGDLTIVVDGLIHDRVRIRECAPFRPSGVRIKTGELSVELFEPTATALLMTNVEDLEVSVPTNKSWRLIQISGSKINPMPNGCSLLLHGPQSDLRAENFGSVSPRAPAPESIEISNSSVSRDLVATLSALSLRHSGTHAAKALQDLCLTDRGAAAKWADEFGLQWLYPQVAALTKTRS
jgi:hypothetical protein